MPNILLICQEKNIFESTLQCGQQFFVCEWCKKALKWNKTMPIVFGWHFIVGNLKKTGLNGKV